MDAAIRSVSVLEQTNPKSSKDHRSFVVLNADGGSGWYGPVSCQVGRYVRRVIAPSIVGKSALDHRDLYRRLCSSLGQDAKPVASWAVGAVDCAAWDLHGILADTPVARLLSRSVASEVPLYASWLSLDIAAEPSASLMKQVARGGWQFTKWGLKRDLSCAATEEATRLASTLLKVSAALGETAAFDASFTWGVETTQRVADRLCSRDLIWLEDPVSGPEAYANIVSEAPFAFGEGLLVHDDGDTLLELKPRAFTIDVVGCGGLTRAIDLVIAAKARGILVYPHGQSFMPALHLAAAFPTAIPAVEYRLQWEQARQTQYKHQLCPDSGVLELPTRPGLSTEPRSHS